MMSKEDLHHNQGEHEEYDFEEDEEDISEDFYGSDELEEENQVTDFFEEHHKKKINSCTVLSNEDIRQRQEEGMERVCSILSISKDEAVILLLHFGWNFQNVIDEWLVREDIRRYLGLFETRVSEIDPNSVRYCGVCRDSYCISGMRAGACGHYFCNGCWLGWIQARIDNAGAGCLRLKCLEPSCECSVGQEMVLYLLSSSEESYLKRYRQNLVRSYVESKKAIKWCPAPGCEYAVEVDICGSGSGSYEVTCKCCHEFCWNCSVENHNPIDCEIVKKWMLKDNDNDRTEYWKYINTKLCPKCKTAIEKHLGCRHITCAFCRFEFCWFCHGKWNDHDAHYSCKRYNRSEHDEVEREQNGDTLKTKVEMYTHYYRLWAANESLTAKALSDMQSFQNSGFEKLRISKCQSNQGLQFVIDAWLQIVDCRRVLKWTYAYRYFLAQSKHAKDIAYNNLFEHSQASAKSSLEQLHECAGQELKGFISRERAQQDFLDYRMKLTDLTNATGNYFKNLITACERGLDIENLD